MRDALRRIFGHLPSRDGVSWEEASEMWLRFDMIAADYCPPPGVRKIIDGDGSIFSYGQVAGETAAYLKLPCGLRPASGMPGAGCWCGRAASLPKHCIRAPGCYHGFDAVEALIDAAGRIFDPSRFHFRHPSVFSEEYNPDPSAPGPGTVRFPYDGGYFDIVILNSVFTHMLPRGMGRYVSEVSRVLKADGRCFATFFLRQNNPEDQGGKWDARHDWDGLHAVDGAPKDRVAVGDREKPGSWVAYDADYVLDTFGGAGMRAVHGPLFGNWSGNLDWLTHQDVLVFGKGAAG